MIVVVRRLGIALGSLVMSYLAVSLVTGVLLGPSARHNPLVGILIVVVGALVCADIFRRERPRITTDGPEPAFRLGR